MARSFWSWMTRQAWRSATSSRNTRRGNQHKKQPLLEHLESRDLPSTVYSPTYILLSHKAGSATPFSTSGPTGTTPAQIKQAYGINQISFDNGTLAGTGAGTTIAIVDAYDDPNIASDLQSFDAAYGLPNPPSFTKVNQSGGSNLPAGNHGWAVEIALDVEWSHAIAPGASILLVEANNASNTNLDAAVTYAAKQAGVVAVSMSWGGSESSNEASQDSIFTTPAGHTGVTFLVSSGDSGAPAEYPAASPNVVSVGGTTLNLTSSGNISTETAWSDSGGGPAPQANPSQATKAAWSLNPRPNAPLPMSHTTPIRIPALPFMTPTTTRSRTRGRNTVAPATRRLSGLASLRSPTRAESRPGSLRSMAAVRRCPCFIPCLPLTSTTSPAAPRPASPTKAQVQAMTWRLAAAHLSPTFWLPPWPGKR